jgi:hypothetical protein
MLEGSSTHSKLPGGALQLPAKTIYMMNNMTRPAFFNELFGKAKCQNIMDTLPFPLALKNVKKEN